MENKYGKNNYIFCQSIKQIIFFILENNFKIELFKNICFEIIEIAFYFCFMLILGLAG